MFTKKQNNSKDPGDNDDISLEPTEEIIGEEYLTEKIKNLREKLEACSKERTEYLAGWQRAKADYVNLQKDMSAKHGESIQLTIGRVVGDIIPVMDSFELAMANKDLWNTTPENWRRGVEHIYSQLKRALEDQGLEEICPKEEDNVEFQHHAVVETVLTDKKGSDGKVSAVLQKGYSLNGKVLRPAKVTAFLYKD